MFNGYLTRLLQYIFFYFLNFYAPTTLLVQWSMLAFCMPLISYFHVVVVLAYLFVLLQFGCLGFCNQNCNIVFGGVVFASLFLCCMLFIVA
jgi:hypothetical protein